MRGLLLGGAFGDALGAPVEFMRRAEILKRFGPAGITAFAPAYGRLGAITDDTQMTLFTLEGLIRAQMRLAMKGMCSPPSVIDHAYRRWYATQVGADQVEGELDGWLITVPELWSRRAPGNTCLGALAEARPFGERAQNGSKGAGGIMRVAPIGLFMRDPLQEACHVAAVTHGHVTGQVAAGWFADWIRFAAEGGSPKSAAYRAWSRCQGQAPELDAALHAAFLLAAEGPKDCAPTRLGEGWIAEEAAAIALWCIATAPDPLEAVRLAVNIDGDSDTTGTLVGQLLGVVHGPDWIPATMLEQLELREVMETLAADAAWFFWGGENADGEAWNGGEYADPNPSSQRFWDRYPGW